LSKATWSGRFRGRPRRRGTRIPSSTGSSCVLSCRWPAVRRIASGRPRPSAARCSLVVSPPRLRPSASSTGGTSPFFRRRQRLGRGGCVACPGRMLMRPDGGPVDRDHRPDDGPDCVRCALQGLEDLLPDPLAAPTKQPVVAGLPFPVPLRQITPGGPGAQHPEDPVEDPPMILVLAAPLPLGGGQLGFQSFPFLVSQVCACHSGTYLPR
jgi:hypothetical protein